MSFYFPNIDPVFVHKRKGDSTDPFIPLNESSVKVLNGKVILREVPDFQSPVIVKNSSQVALVKTTNATLLANQFRVDYSVGIVFVHSSLEGQNISIEYTGMGYVSFPAERVWIDGEEAPVTLQSLADEARATIDNLVGTDVGSIESKIGSLPTLQTGNKTSLVQAVNEIHAELDSVPVVTDSAVNGNVVIDDQESVVYTHPANHPASIITQDANNRMVTDAEKATWNAKASTSLATTSANGLMPKEDKTKINDIDLTNKVDGYALQYDAATSKVVLKSIPAQNNVGGAVINDATSTSTTETWSASKIGAELDAKANISHKHALSDLLEPVVRKVNGVVPDLDGNVIISSSGESANVGDITQLPTVDKSNVVNAIKEQSGDIQGRAINVKYPPLPILPAKGDANYYKTADGKWYKDSAYTQLATDDTPTFQAVDALGKAIFCPPGTYFTQGIDLLGFYYGKDAKIIVKERDAFNATLAPSQRTGVRTFALGSTPQPILNEFYGKNSGSKVQVDAYANTSLGENSLANLTTGKRNTAIGYQSQLTNPSQYSNTSIGADSLSTGRFFTRITAVGENALKWAGCLDPIASRHELWVNEFDVYNLYLDPSSDFYRLKTNNPNVEKIIQPTGSPTPTGAQIVNPGGGFPAATMSDDVSANVAIGRNAMLHHVKGSDNVAVGYQALAHSYVSNSNTAIGNYALADGLQGTENTAVGKNALNVNQTGSNNVVVGSGSMGSNIFGSRNTVIGSNAAGGFTGDNSILIGYKAKGLSNTSSRQFALDYGNDGAPIPYLYGSMSVGTEYFGTRAKEFRLGGDAGVNGGVKWITGVGVPNVAAPVGSMYTRTDGGAGSTLYVKESGTGTTGWVAK